jgi:hypothetical protein
MRAGTSVSLIWNAPRHLCGNIAPVHCRDGNQYAPDDRTTAVMVRNRITRSKLSDQFST